MSRNAHGHGHGHAHANLPSGISTEDPSQIYELLQEVGSGTYGAVHKSRNKRTGQTVAAKIISLEDGEELREVHQEIAILKDCDHENVVRYYASHVRAGKLWIIMEYCGGGSVERVYKVLGEPLDEREIAAIMHEALQGLGYLAARGKIHRDIKGGNILLTDEGKVKLADFGVAAQLTSTMARRQTFIGTPYWMAPEVITAEQSDGRYNSKCDIWSLGITAIECAEMSPPMSDLHPMRALFLIPKNQPPQLTDRRRWSKDFQDFIAKCLTMNPDERPSAGDLLNHPFVAGTSVAHSEVLRELVDRAKEAILELEMEARDGLEYDSEDDDEVPSLGRRGSRKSTGAAQVPQATRRMSSAEGTDRNAAAPEPAYVSMAMARPSPDGHGASPLDDGYAQLSSVRPQGAPQRSREESPYETLFDAPSDGSATARRSDYSDVFAGDAANAPSAPRRRSDYADVFDMAPVPSARGGEGSAPSSRPTSTDGDDYDDVFDYLPGDAPRGHRSNRRGSAADAMARPECPVCGAVLAGMSEVAMNQHVEDCLTNGPGEGSSAGASSSSSRQNARRSIDGPACPVCERSFRDMSEFAMTRHVEDCLSGNGGDSGPSAGSSATVQRAPRGGRDQAPRQQASRTPSYAFGLVFNGCPYKVLCGTSWEAKLPRGDTGRFVLLGTSVGLYVMDVTNPGPADLMLVSTRKFHYVAALPELGVVASISGKSAQVCLHDLDSLAHKARVPSQPGTLTSQSGTGLSADVFKGLLAREGKAKKLPGTKGALCVRASKSPSTGFVYLCAIMPRSIVLMQWSPHPFNKFMKIKDFPTGITTAPPVACLIFFENLTLPCLCVGSRTDETRAMRLACVDFNAPVAAVTALLSTPAGWNIGAGEAMAVSKISQMSSHRILIVQDSGAKIVDPRGEPIHTSSGYASHIVFDRKPNSTLVLPTTLIGFSDHTVEGRSLHSGRLTHFLETEEHVRLVVDNGELSVMETTRHPDKGPYNLHLLIKS